MRTSTSRSRLVKSGKGRCDVARRVREAGHDAGRNCGAENGLPARHGYVHGYEHDARHQDQGHGHRLESCHGLVNHLSGGSPCQKAHSPNRNTRWLSVMTGLGMLPPVRRGAVDHPLPHLGHGDTHRCPYGGSEVGMLPAIGLQPLAPAATRMTKTHRSTRAKRLANQRPPTRVRYPLGNPRRRRLHLHFFL